MDNETLLTLLSIPLVTLFDGIPHGVAIIDNELRLVLMNQFLEALIGFSLADVKGVYIDSVLRSSIANRGRAFRDILKTGLPAVLNGDILNRDRRLIPIQFTVTPLHGPDTSPIGLMVALDDLRPTTAPVSTAEKDHTIEGLISQSPKMQEVLELVPLLARTEASVLITGETGTGKDRIAEIIHQQSNRANKPFIKINCGALPESLLESELFGYVKGAFTGAARDKDGMFAMAQGGTLFLTEIGDMPLSLQVKLLSVLDDREFYPLGGEKKISVDVRIITATHRSLRDRVLTGEFREDLYYRLNVLNLHLPPLRERESDIQFLLNYFLRFLGDKTGSRVKTFSEEALSLLLAYPFPGNIRELRNIVEYCVNICPDALVVVDQLPQYLQQWQATVDNGPAVPTKATAKVDTLVVPLTCIHPLPARTPMKGWQTVEKELIVSTLNQTRGNRVKAAALLGWGRTTLWRKLKVHGLMTMHSPKSASETVS
jgi:transcriptional regulator with PAS, ATPase and Fis domain